MQLLIITSSPFFSSQILEGTFCGFEHFRSVDKIFFHMKIVKLCW